MFSLFFPDLCLGCDAELGLGEKNLCSKCQKPIEQGPFSITETPVAQKLWGRLPISGGAALWSFLDGGAPQHIIHRLKYENRPQACVYAGRLLGKQILALTQNTPPWDAVAYVPMHPAKERKRGYNQAKKIAQGVCRELNLPLAEAIAKKEETRSQTRLGRLARWQNTFQAFGRKKSNLALEGMSVLLVDDVITTGATLEAAAQPLLAAGVKDIGIAVLANVL
jgi:ComF family protein